MKKLIFTLLGIVLFLSLLCSFAAGVILNPAVMQSGFETLEGPDEMQVRAFGVTPADYGTYARSIVTYLSGKGEKCTVPGPDGSETPAFPDADGDESMSRQDLHMKDVRGIMRGMVAARYFGCGGVLSVLCAWYLISRAKKSAFPLQEVLDGFSIASLILLGLFAALGVWALCDFYGLFYKMHLLLFPGNTLWRLDPSRHLLMALMPLSFFRFYAGRLLTALLPMLGIMICLPVANFKYKKVSEK